VDSVPEITLLYDGGCPLCSKEIEYLKRRAGRSGRIGFDDIWGPSFDASLYGLKPEVLMARMHGVLADGTVVEGLEVFRRAYRAVGLGWLLAPTGWIGLRRIADWAYGVFARYRLQRRCAEGCEIGQNRPELMDESEPST
jgi:predicted DCC family thiol-disulfide oxidoreductase YuxK